MRDLAHDHSPDDGGDGMAGGQEIKMHPLLKVLEGGGDAQTLTGRQVIREMVDLLEERVPLVTSSDPSLRHLWDLHAVLAAQLLTPHSSRHG